MVRDGYYTDVLAAERLRKVYEIAPPRVQRYLEAEIEFVLHRTLPAASVIELGCGYGRVLRRLQEKARFVLGVDTSMASLELARGMVASGPCFLAGMNAARLGVVRGCFDLVVCIQNGISAFHVDRQVLVDEAVRITAPGGKVLLSSYSSAFWDHRLRWFELQAEHGLIGEIDHDATGDGVIVCKDGFRAETVGADGFRELASKHGIKPRIAEVDGSSLFCEIDLR